MYKVKYVNKLTKIRKFYILNNIFLNKIIKVMLRPPYFGRTVKYKVACTLVKVHARPWALPWNFHGPRRLYK